MQSSTRQNNYKKRRKNEEKTHRRWCTVGQVGLTQPQSNEPKNMAAEITGVDIGRVSREGADDDEVDFTELSQAVEMQA